SAQSIGINLSDTLTNNGTISAVNSIAFTGSGMTLKGSPANPLSVSANNGSITFLVNQLNVDTPYTFDATGTGTTIELETAFDLDLNAGSTFNLGANSQVIFKGTFQFNQSVNVDAAQTINAGANSTVSFAATNDVNFTNGSTFNMGAGS